VWGSEGYASGQCLKFYMQSCLFWCLIIIIIIIIIIQYLYSAMESKILSCQYFYWTVTTVYSY